MLLHPPALHRLQQLGVMSEAIACGAPVRRICAQTLHGRPLMDFGYGDIVAGQSGLGIQRSTLHRLLSNADSGRDQVCVGCKIVSIDPDHGYLMEESSVRHGPFDLIIVADGTHSLLRKRISASKRYERPANSAALVGLLDDPVGLAGDRLMQYFDSTRHLSVWPVGRESSTDPPRCGIAMNVPLAQAAIFRDSGLWRNLMTHLFPGVGRMVNDSIENHNLHIYTYRDVELNRCSFGRAVVIGDAAHSMSPQLGNGAQLAMEDAAKLATAVDQHDDLPSALNAYALNRSPQLRRYHRASRWLTPLFQSDSRVLAMVRDHLFVYAMRLPTAKRVVHALLF